MNIVWKQFRPALLLLVAMTVVTGGLYPALITAAAQALFPFRANGSLLVKDGKAAGSELIGQPFSDPARFWSRPSATTPFPYNAGSSSGSNLGPTNPALFNAVKARVEALRKADRGNDAPVPVDLVTASGSGLDPHISPEAGFYQAPRVARVRRVPLEDVRRLIERHIERPALGFLGEPRVNVLLLNLELDELARKSFN